MQKQKRFMILMLVGLLLTAMPFSAMAAETFFKNYLGKTAKEVLAAEGEPDEIEKQKSGSFLKKSILLDITKKYWGNAIFP